MLRLLIPPTWPMQGAACEWALLDEQGRLQQSGFSDPRTWPEADACEVVLTAPQCLCLYADIPAGAGKLKDDVVVLALEDQLLGEIDDEHWVVGRAGRNGRVPVWLVSRQRVANILDTMRQLGRKLGWMTWEPQLATVRDGCWSVVLMSERGFIHTDDGRAWAFDTDGAAPPVELALALAAAKETGGMPSSLEIVSASPQAPDWQDWTRHLGLPCNAGESWDWRTAPLSRTRNFLVGQFAIAGDRQVLRRMKPAAWVIGVALAMYCAAITADWYLLRQKERKVLEEITAIYKRSFPGDRPLLDPYAQLQADAGRLANVKGELAASDFLTLMAELGADAGANSGQVGRIRYENRQLRIEWASPPAEPARLVHALQARGLTAQIVADPGRPSMLLLGAGQ